MRISEFALHESIIESINRILPVNEAENLISQLCESIKGNNTLVDTFIDTHRTSLPEENKNYFPVSVVFLIGQDKIEITYANSSFKFTGIGNGYYMYNRDDTIKKFPPENKLSLIATSTFHCCTLNESKEIRAVIYMIFGDCGITEVKL